MTFTGYYDTQGNPIHVNDTCTGNLVISVSPFISIEHRGTVHKNGSTFVYEYQDGIAKLSDVLERDAVFRIL